MRVLVDTNVLISAFGFASASCSRVLQWTIKNEQLFIPSHVVSEALRVMNDKRPHGIALLAAFLERPTILTTELSAGVPHESPQIRDPYDQPILDAAVSANIDIIITGDKDFHALGLDRPRVMSPSDFIAEFLDS